MQSFVRVFGANPKVTLDEATFSTVGNMRVSHFAQEVQIYAVFRKSYRLIDGDRIICRGLRVPRSRFRRPRDYPGTSTCGATARAADNAGAEQLERARGKSQIRRKDRPQYGGTSENVICNAAIAAYTRCGRDLEWLPRAPSLALVKFGRRANNRLSNFLVFKLSEAYYIYIHTP